jgi:hypothetical protein
MKFVDVAKNPRLKQIVLLGFELFLFALYLRLRVLNSQSIHSPRVSFGDTKDYLLIASQSLLSSQFWLSDKPFFVPLFFKMLGGNPGIIFTAQLYFSIFCWGIFAFAFASVIRSYPLKFVAFATILGFSLSQQVILWDSLLLSESLHFSLSALFYASGFWLIKKWGILQAILFIILAAMLVFVRDANAYMFLMAGAVLLALILFTQYRLRLILIGGAFTAIFLISYILSSAGGHSYSPMLNIIGLRILPNQEYLAYFEQQGMPVSGALLERTGTASFWDDLAMMNDPRLSTFRTWVQQHGTITLVKFLWHYRADTIQKPLNDPVTVLAPDLYYYSSTGFKPILEKSNLSEILYPMRFGIILFWLANMFAAFVSVIAFQMKKILWLLPLLMILLAYPQIIFVWNADPNDLLRHSLHLNVQWRLGLWLLIFFSLDYVIEQLAPKMREFFVSHAYRIFPNAPYSPISKIVIRRAPVRMDDRP